MKTYNLRLLVILSILSGLFSSCRENVIQPPVVEHPPVVEPPAPPPTPPPSLPVEGFPPAEVYRLLEGEDPPDLIYLPYEGYYTPDISSISFPMYDEDNEAEGIVAFKRCPDEAPVRLSFGQYPRGEAYLFKDSVPKLLNVRLKYSWTILFDSKADMAYFFFKVGKVITVSGRFCNFPDFAKEWNIPENGCRVSFEGVNYGNGLIPEMPWRYYILTNFKKI